MPPRFQTFQAISILLILLTAPRFSGANHNYGDALKKSLLLIKGQCSGKLPSEQRLKWQKDSTLTDGATARVDLTGGYYDASDNVKFGFPVAFTTTLLARSVIDFGKNMGLELTHAITAVKWAMDYLLKVMAMPRTVYIQVGDAFSDHGFWERLEDMDTKRTVYRVDKNHPGPDVTGETAAALAVASIVFCLRDSGYSRLLLDRAIKVFEFADNHKGAYSNSLEYAVCPFYCDVDGYESPLCTS